MSSAGKWEVVKSGKHKNASNQPGFGKPGKNQKKKGIENMPKIDQNQVNLTVFNIQENIKDKSIISNYSVLRHLLIGCYFTKNEKETLNSDDFLSLLETVQTNFPNTPSVWLKDLASYINEKMNVDISDPVFTGKPFTYPLSLLPGDIRKILNETLNRCTPETLQLFTDFCLHTMVQDITKGHPTCGYRLFLQCVAHEKPEIILKNLNKCSDFRKSYQNRQPVCLSVLWAAGQAGAKDLKAGLKVWLELMLPMVGMRAYSKFTIDYLDNLLNMHPKVKCASDVLGVREFFSVFDFLFTSTGLHDNLHKKLQSLYPKLKALSYGTSPESNYRSFFPSYLRRLQNSCSPALTKELLSSLETCLIQDTICYSVWRQLYTKHLVQSSILMKHLVDEWDKLPSSFPRSLLKETLSTFRVTNEELSSQGKTNQEGFTACVSNCNELFAKMTARSFPWRRLLMFFMFVVSAALAYDIHVHGSFQKSQTGKFLKDIGVLAVCQQAWGRITVYSNKAYRWAENHVPVYYRKVSTFFGYYLEIFWTNFFALCMYVWNSTQGLRDWINVKIPPLLEWLNSKLPKFTEKVVAVALDSWLVIQKYLVWLGSHLVYYLTIIGSWLQENVFTGNLSVENLQKYAVDTGATVQKYVVLVYQWSAQQVSGLVSSGK
ncbi:transmembrane protein 214-like [Limulus polyphemus]|uniref:Transmembrane protein 214-like n=1 Tax=Limulus polyphemus TaxID=6850 RepID=A0ABM1BW64_LIMPO|nr:transmembrane protein 214-like [Limulus polyphemus]